MDNSIAFPILFALIGLALAFDFLNGLHDAANSIATVVSTRLLSPVAAVVFAACGNFAAYWLVGLQVAETVGEGIIDKDVVTPAVVFGALVGAMFWNVLTWLKGIPSSSSHALIGGILRHHQDDGRHFTVADDRFHDSHASHAGHILAVQAGSAAKGGGRFQGLPPDVLGGLFDQPWRQ